MSDTTGVQEHWTEDDGEVMAAAKALAAYYDGDDDEAENWIAGAVVALNATNYRGGRGRADALEAALPEHRVRAIARVLYMVDGADFDLIVRERADGPTATLVARKIAEALPDDVLVPDEAAIERGAKALYELSRGQAWPGHIGDLDVRHVGLLTVVDTVLRALGDG